MAILPKKFNPAQGGTEQRLKALEDYVEYLVERLEYNASITNKQIEEVKKNGENI